MVRKVKFLVRLDDACPQFNLKNWNKIEDILDRNNIKPIVAVIPKNKDKKINYGKMSEESFWLKISNWNKKNWSIAMHGFDHIYKTKNPGIIPISSKSEFAGLSLEKQKNKIKSGWSCFTKNNINPKIWISPSHSLDLNTIDAIRSETNIRIISDGIALDQYYEYDMHWIPQQIWSFKNIFFGKIWTVCLHPNTMKDKDFDKLENDLRKFSKQIISAEDINFKKRRKNSLEKIFTFIFFKVLFFKKLKLKK